MSGNCYVCGADPHDSCAAIGGEVAECPRMECYPVAEILRDEGRPGPMPDDLTPNEVFGVGGRCRRGGQHQFEPDWRGRGFDYLRCRWCGKREAV